MKIKLGNYQSYTFSEVMKLQGNHGRFVTFQWIIPLPMFLPVKRLSNVYFIESDTNIKRYARKYNLLNYLFGWWGLPFGPVYLFKSIHLNNRGGIDVTDDVYLNLNESDFKNGTVDIIKKSTIYIHPKKSESKEFEKVFNEVITSGIISSPPIIGLYIDTKENESPYYLIGIDQEVTKEMEEKISKSIYKRFYKQLKFNIVEVDSLGENKSKFIQQGLKINQ
ncbi:MAG: hypothetical protein CL840_21745 [Crocinitomicaceae bacterium]|nr:hypothetical protein [Crocinitomicaceae bacterium]|tara:strand:+ start:10317 stop:10982 length:666 start_codon:yes stop_codon:yes gene_type:complete